MVAVITGEIQVNGAPNTQKQRYDAARKQSEGPPSVRFSFPFNGLVRAVDAGKAGHSMALESHKG